MVIGGVKDGSVTVYCKLVNIPNLICHLPPRPHRRAVWWFPVARGTRGRWVSSPLAGTRADVQTGTHNRNRMTPETNVTHSQGSAGN